MSNFTRQLFYQLKNLNLNDKEFLSCTDQNIDELNDNNLLNFKIIRKNSLENYFEENLISNRKIVNKNFQESYLKDFFHLELLKNLNNLTLSNYVNLSRNY